MEVDHGRSAMNDTDPRDEGPVAIGERAHEHVRSCDVGKLAE
jgi:hypothetical protein